MSFAFSRTDYRCVNTDTRKLSLYAMQKFETAKDNHTLLFLLEANLYRHNFGALQSFIAEQQTITDLLVNLERITQLETFRPDAIQFNLLPYAKLWDIFTAQFFTNDYSREDLARIATILSSFSEHIIMRGIKECEPGKALSYATKIFERMRAETLPALRREELYASKVNTSVPITVPQFRNPGFVSQSVAEELFFRALQ